MKFLLALLATTSLVSVEALQCYQAQGDDPHIPADRKNITALANIGCAKIYRSQFKIGQPATTVSYAWDEFDLGAISSDYVRCGDSFEVSSIFVDGMQQVFAVYDRYCICCDDFCNGPMMDGQCNDEPEFDKQCYAASYQSNQNMPANANMVPATTSQVCYKSSKLLNHGEMQYKWGGVSVEQGVCGDSLTVSSGGTFYKACTCCGELCNGAAMNKMNALNTTDCQGNVITPTTAPPFTFVPPDTTTWPTVIVVPCGFDAGAFFGGIALGIALVIGALIGYHYFKKHQQKQTFEQI